MLKINGKVVKEIPISPEQLLERLDALPDDELFTIAQIIDRFKVTPALLKYRIKNLSGYFVRINTSLNYYGNKKTIKKYKNGDYFKG